MRSTLIDRASRETGRITATLSAVLAMICLVSTGAGAQLVASGSVWRYLDDGSDRGIAWRAPAFDDSTWATGAAELGYGDGDETTVVGFGPDSLEKYSTTYFRHSFLVADPGPISTLILGLVRDDGAVVYLNGIEVVRDNMPAGVVLFDTLAASTVADADEGALRSFTIDPTLIVPGNNVLAVEIHQRSRTSSDISFDLRLDDDPGAVVTRGPYLQLGTSSEITVRWRTAVATDSRVEFGTSPLEPDFVVTDQAIVTDHEVSLTGLDPSTTYHYLIGSSMVTYRGGDGDHFFVTSPPVGSTHPVRLWVLGDSGRANANARAVRDAYYSFAATTHTNLWLLLGDNAYNSGTEAQYQAAVYDMYPEMLRKSVVWSTRGNHERSAGVYYGMFSFPTGGEAGGLPSGSEAYYSFDYANIHFVCLDSEGTVRTAMGAMGTWLEADLASTDQRWIIAFWHHPPYTRGSHNSDNVSDSGGRMRDMRVNMLPILEEGGVDLVLSGHSHSYERSFLIGGHYGLSSTFGPNNVFDGGDGREDGNGAYRNSVAPNTGTVYCVAGSSGGTSPGALNHPAMHSSILALGSVILDVDGDRLDMRFLDGGGVIRDYLTLLTEDPVPPTITNVDPDAGPIRGGTEVTVSGTRFLPNAEVLFGGQTLVPISRSETAIVVTSLPGMAVGNQVDLVVRQGTGEAIAPGAFTYGENSIDVMWTGTPSPGGNVTITVYGPANKDVAIAAGTPGMSKAGGIVFCAERPFPLIRRFFTGFNTGPTGRVDIPWNNLPAQAFRTWNIVGAIRLEFGNLADLGCTPLTVFP